MQISRLVLTAIRGYRGNNSILSYLESIERRRLKMFHWNLIAPTMSPRRFLAETKTQTLRIPRVFAISYDFPEFSINDTHLAVGVDFSSNFAKVDIRIRLLDVSLWNFWKKYG